MAAEPVADNIQIMSGWRSFFIAILVLGSFTQQTIAQTTGALCPNPRARCTSTYSFASYQLPFVIKENLVFGKTYKSTAFYAIVLKSVRSSADSDCKFIAEDERDAAQSQFPASKVFTSRHSCPEELVLYENVDPNLNFMAVYAGATAATAKRMLSRVRASGRYPQAYIKQFRVVLEYLT